MDLTWLSGSGLLLVLGSVVTWLVRWIVKDVRQQAREAIQREREISEGWKTVAETYAETDRHRSETVARNNEVLGHILLVLEQAPWVITAPKVGSHSWDASAATKRWLGESPPLPWRPPNSPSG